MNFHSQVSMTSGRRRSLSLARIHGTMMNSSLNASLVIESIILSANILESNWVRSSSALLCCSDPWWWTEIDQLKRAWRSERKVMMRKRHELLTVDQLSTIKTQLKMTCRLHDEQLYEAMKLLINSSFCCLNSYPSSRNLSASRNDDMEPKMNLWSDRKIDAFILLFDVIQRKEFDGHLRINL